MDSSTEKISFNIIANSGDGRSFAFEALKSARLGDFEKSEELIKKSDESLNLAHKTQTELLCQEANGNKTDVDVLLIHAQDHLMTSILANELIKEMILLYENR